MNPIQREIFKSIDIITDKKIEDIQLDKTIIAKIIAHPTPSQNLYRIQYQGLTYDAFSSTNESYTVSDSVLVLVPSNQFSNKKIILMKEPKVAEALTTASGGGTSVTGVTQVSIVTANGFAGTVANSTSTASITLTTTVNGILKGNGTAISAASAGTDFASPTFGTSLLYGNGTGTFSNATIGTGLQFTGGQLSNTSLMTYPGSGIPNSTGTAWATSYSVTGTGSVVVLSNSPTVSTASFTGQTFFPDGTVTAPSIAHSGDTNTGVYFPAVDEMSLVSNGAERITIRDGNVGIGLAALTQTSGTGYINNKFLVNALSATNLDYDISANTVGAFIRRGNANISLIGARSNTQRLQFGDTSSEAISSISHNGSAHASRPSEMFFTIGGTESMRLTQAGNVGIGTTTATQKLEVIGSISASSQLISTVVTGTAPLIVLSTTKVTNLNADLLDDQTGTYYLDYNNFTNTPTIGNGALTMSTSGLGISGSANFSANTTSNITFTVTSNATSSNVASTIVARSANGSVSITDLTLSGQGLFAAGSVGAPSISFSADTNTGVYSPTADTIGFVESGSEVVRIDSSGRLLTGLTAPLGSTGNSLVHARQGFSAYNDGSTAPFFQTYHGSASTDLKTWRHGGNSSGNYEFQTVNDAYSTANTRVIMYNTGEVGIGTSAPLSKLHINSNTTTPGYTIVTNANLIVTGVDAAANAVELDSFAGTNQIIARRANTTLASPTAVGGNTNMLQIGSRAYNGTAYPTTDSARIAFLTNAAQTTTASGASITFFNTTTGTTSIVEAMRIHGPQELLIGYTTSNSTSTSFKLQVNSQIFATSGTIATSDGNYKQNIEPLTDSLDIINALNPISFNWKPHPVHNFDLNTTTVGFIAQEVKEVLKDKPYVNSIIKQNQSIYQDEDGNEIIEPFLGIAEGNLIAILTSAIKEQQKQIDQLKSEIDLLKTMVQ